MPICDTSMDAKYSGPDENKDNQRRSIMLIADGEIEIDATVAAEMLGRPMIGQPEFVTHDDTDRAIVVSDKT